MVKRNIVLGNVANVQEFNRICGHMDFDVDLAQGKYLVDAKSSWAFSVWTWKNH